MANYGLDCKYVYTYYNVTLLDTPIQSNALCSPVVISYSCNSVIELHMLNFGDIFHKYAFTRGMHK